MVKERFNTERTPAGQQFVIPGTEKPAPQPRKKYESDGGQLVIPGAEKIDAKQLLRRIMQQPLRPRVAQRGLAGSRLFGMDRSK